MQSVEAIISLMVLVFILSSMLSQITEKQGLDDSLYRYQLAGDVWRVAYLRGNLRDLNLSAENETRDALQDTFEEIEEQTGICSYLSGKVVTSCTDKKKVLDIVSINRVLYDRGIAKNVTLTLAKSE